MKILIRPLNILFMFILAVIISLTAFSQQPDVYEHNIKFVNNSTASLVGEDGVIMQTTDNGLTWSEQNSGITNTLYGNAFFDMNTQIAVGENGIILKTTDGGITWYTVNSGVTENLNDIEVLSFSMAIVCGDAGKILITLDMGDSWLETAAGTSANLKDINFVNGQTGIIVGNNSVMLKTLNSGASWDIITPGFSQKNLNTAAMITEGTFTVAGENGFIATTIDGGLTWNTSGSFEGHIYDIKYFDANNGVLVGNNGMVYRTSNGGNTWFSVTPVSVDAALDLMSVSFSSEINGITVGENGIELYTNDGGLTWSKSPEEINRISFNQADIKAAGNYPNPFNPVTKIRFEISKAGNISLAVFDITGREVKQVFNGYTNAGFHEFTFDASGLASGIYFYTISAYGNKTVTNKMILTK